MVKVEEALLSGLYDVSTCQNLIQIIANVPGDSNCALLFFDTICKVVESLESKGLLQSLITHLLRALMKMTIKVPLLFESTCEFLMSRLKTDQSKTSVDLWSEALSILSRCYCFSEIQLDQLAGELE